MLVNQYLLVLHYRTKRMNSTIPLKPLVSAPFKTESDSSVTTAKSTFDPAVLSCKTNKNSIRFPVHLKCYFCN